VCYKCSVSYRVGGLGPNNAHPRRKTLVFSQMINVSHKTFVVLVGL